jgi:D-sedoheptulose 7-phosphate isomerase
MIDKIINKAFFDLSEALTIGEGQKTLLLAAGRSLAQCLVNGGTIFLCGNGGSAAEAQHLAAEFVGRFLMERPGLAAISLTVDTSKLTAIGNDYGYEEVFARQISALGRPGDFLWGLSTSGRSPNILKAFKAAKENELKTLFFCGPQVFEPEAAQVIIPAPGATTPRVQEMHLLYGHILCHIVEQVIFAGPGEGNC